MDLKRLRQILERASSKRILVIGDLMLDEFVWGKVGRISPEAPVPVVQVTSETFFPGAAASVARNLREFVGKISANGLIGQARRAPPLPQLMPHANITIPESSDHQPTRAGPLSAAGVEDLDSDPAPKKDVDLVRAGKELLQKWGIQYLLVTLGEQGVMFFEKGKHPHHIPTKARDVFDVSGAGDTAIAMFTLALTGNATPLEAAQIANHSSAVVVGKLGTATVTRDELVASFEHDSK